MDSGRRFKPSPVKTDTLVMIGTLASISDTDGKKRFFPACLLRRRFFFKDYSDTSELVMPRMDFLKMN